MIFEETYTPHNGVRIPKLGLGTWLIEKDRTEQAVRDAIRIGYRHFDSAQAYGSEAEVGRGILASGVPREDIFVTSKIAAEYKTYETVEASIHETLEKMGMSYIDMVLIHSPQPWNGFRENDRYFAENREVWRALEDAYDAGKVRAIGVSNFLEDDLANILARCKVKPMVNQVLAHIGNTPFEMVRFCEEHGILVEAYSPVAHGAILNHGSVMEIAGRYGVSVPQLCIRYILQLGMAALPKTANPEHMRVNAQLDFDIKDDDMESLKRIKRLSSYGEHSFFPVFRTQLR